jgi:O-antigen/teichoic acid export membrane protein
MTAQAAGMHIFTRRALMGNSILVVESALCLALVAAVSPWIARELGPARFGLLNHVSALAWAVALEALLVSAALLLANRRRAAAEPGGPRRVQRAQMVVLLRACCPYLVAALAAGAYMKIDAVMMGVLSSDEVTGLHSLSQKLYDVLYLLPVIVVDLLYPALVRHQALHGQGAVLQVFFDLTFATALLATLLAWAFLGIVLNHARFRRMVATGRQSLAPAVALLGVLLALGLHALLVPASGATGEALGTLAAYLVSWQLVFYAIRALRPVAAMQTRALWPWDRLWAVWNRGRATLPTRRGTA